jgi:hypothetical protein
MMEDKYQADDQKPCDCPTPVMGPKNGPIKVKIIKSMMKDRCQDDRPMMGSENGPIRVKIVKSMMGQDDKLRLKAHVKSMTGNRYQDDDLNSCDCPRHAMEDRC